LLQNAFDNTLAAMLMRRVALPMVMLTAVAACGSTVQVTGTGSVGSDGGTGSLAQPGSSGAPAVAGYDGGDRTGGLAGGHGAGGRAGSGDPSSSGDPGSAPGDPAPATSRITTPAAGGSGPLRIGLLVPELGSANSALGAQSTSAVSPKSVASALATSLNRTGGIAGHKIEIVYRSWDASSSNYSNEAAASCAYFTQDAPVPVVIDLGFGLHYGMQACLGKKGEATLGPPSDDAATSAARLFATPNYVTSSRRYRAVVQGLSDTGYLTQKSRIGVVLENCPDLSRAFQQSVRPALTQRGLHLVTTYDMDCTQGFASAGPAASAIQGAVLNFRSNNVDRVLLVSDFEQIALMLFGNQAESQGYRPGYALSSLASAAITRANIPQGQWPQLHGVGSFPYSDIDDPHAAPTPVEKHCLQLIKSGGVNVTSWADRAIAAQMCNNLLLVSASVTQQRGADSGTAIAAGIERLGQSFSVAGLVTGGTLFSSTRRDGPRDGSVFQYVPSCGCSRYSGRPFALR
jgi:ABC-type branched-subunit amino acid transport system substrate-binding protein